LFDSRPAIIGARKWGVNAEAKLQQCDRMPLRSEGGGQAVAHSCRSREFPLAKDKREVPMAKIDLDSLSIEELAGLRENATVRKSSHASRRARSRAG
jgi:hypothetical protein